MTYPNLVNGALAASAPMFWISGMKDSHDFWVKVTSDFNQFPNCENNVRAGFKALRTMADNKQFAEISKIMRVCKPIQGEDDFMHMLGWARNAMVLQESIHFC